MFATCLKHAFQSRTQEYLSNKRKTLNRRKLSNNRDLLMTLGERIRELRTVKGWTQDELAERAGLNGRHLSRFENDHVRPRAQTLRSLAEAFGTTVEELQSPNAKEDVASLIPDQELFHQFQAVCQMDQQDIEAVKRILSALIVKNKIRDLQTA